MRSHESKAYWIDAFCVPAKASVRRATLESMGFIYGRAADVVVVLSEGPFAALERICQWDAKEAPQPDGACLSELEADLWIRSAWAYQEVVNSARLWFVGEARDGIRRRPLRAQDVLDQFGHYLLACEKSHELTSPQLRERYPHLDALEELLEDWRTSAFAQRSALQVMSGMSRLNVDWRDYKSAFYSMIGAVTQEPSSRASDPTPESLAEAFMCLCEQKGDYSFIFSSTDRDERPGQRWRPRAGILPSILPWHCAGEGQPVRRDAQGIWLQDMAVVVRSSTINTAGRALISRWLRDSALGTAREAEIMRRTSSTLAEAGFSGGQAIITAEGLLYPQSPLSATSPVQIGVATRLRYSADFAAPALVSVAEADHTRYVSGLFVGAVPCSVSEFRLDV